jgi:hypothetical protein
VHIVWDKLFSIVGFLVQLLFEFGLFYAFVYRDQPNDFQLEKLKEVQFGFAIRKIILQTANG